VGQADDDLAGLNELIQGILDSGPYELVPEFDPHTRQNTVRAKRVADLPLIKWGTRIGRIAHDLRSALNYVVTELVRNVGGTPSRTHEFPIFNDSALFSERDKEGRPTSRSGLAKIAGIGPDPAALIEGLQPYHGADIPPNIPPGAIVSSALWDLHELNRVDKHQELIAPVPIIKNVTVFSAPSATVDYHVTPGPLEDDAVLLRWTEPAIGEDLQSTFMSVHVPRNAPRITFTPAPNVHVPVDANFTFDVAFSETGPMQGGLVVESLSQIIRAVGVKIELFAPFF